MIKLGKVLLEGKSKLAYRSDVVEYITSYNNGKLVLIPKTSKDLDTIELIKSKLGSKAEDEFIKLTKIRIQQKTGIGFTYDTSHNGAGYGFKIDDNFLLKLVEGK